MSGTSRSCWRCERVGSEPPLSLCAVPVSDLMCVSQQQFSADISSKASSVCLAHLFTYQDFDEGTLGLAYVAPSKPDIAGGLCSKGPHHQHSSAAVANPCPFFALFLHRLPSPSPLLLFLLLPFSLLLLLLLYCFFLCHSLTTFLCMFPQRHLLHLTTRGQCTSTLV